MNDLPKHSRVKITHDEKLFRSIISLPKKRSSTSLAGIILFALIWAIFWCGLWISIISEMMSGTHVYLHMPVMVIGSIAGIIAAIYSVKSSYCPKPIVIDLSQTEICIQDDEKKSTIEKDQILAIDKSISGDGFILQTKNSKSVFARDTLISTNDKIWLESYLKEWINS